MKFWIGIGIIGLLSLSLIVDSARLFLTKLQVTHVEAGYTIGSENADLDVVEFLDYSCAHCRNLEPILEEAVRRDGKIRLIPKPLFAQSEQEGKTAATLAYAAGRQGKFIEAHRILLKNYRAIDDAYIQTFAQTLGVDAEQLRKDMNDPALIKTINKNRSQLVTLKARTTPMLLIGGRLMYMVSDPLPDTDVLLNLFKQGRGL